MSEEKKKPEEDVKDQPKNEKETIVFDPSSWPHVRLDKKRPR